MLGWLPQFSTLIQDLDLRDDVLFGHLKTIVDIVYEEKAEERRALTDKAKKEERDKKLARMTDAEQKKFLDKERAADQKKQQKKMTMRG